MIHNIPTKKFLAIALLFAAAYFAGCFIAEAVNGGQTESASASADGNWGLSFQEEGKPPVANATFDELKQYDAYYAENTEEKVIYLTFDCGYENGNTATILDALKKHNAPATFFVVGNSVSTSPDLVKRMVKEDTSWATTLTTTRICRRYQPWNPSPRSFRNWKISILRPPANL